MSVHNEATQLTTRPIPGRAVLTLRRVDTSGGRSALRLELTPAEARDVAADLFRCAARAEEMEENQDGGRWDGLRGTRVPT